MTIGVEAQSTLGGHDIFARKYVWKINKMPKFYMILPDKLSKYLIFMIFAGKILKIPEFYVIFAWKMPNFFIIIAWKMFSLILGGHVLPPRLLRLC